MQYRFSDFEIDGETHELRRNGESVSLEPQVFDLLLHLVRNPDRLISRDELIEHIWRGRIVSEATISSRINATRRAIGDDGKTQALIKTVPRRGIRFIGHVEPIGGDTATAAPSQLADSPSPPLPDRPSIVVLPFQNLSPDAGNAFLADGMTQDLITSLSHIDAIFVIARNTSFSYSDAVTDHRSLAATLGVQYVLEGSVRGKGNQIRVSAQLIEAQTGKHLWADRFDRETQNVFDVEDEITSEIVAALQVTLTDGEMLRIRRRQTDNLQAWACLMGGVQHLRRFTREDNAEAQLLLDLSLQHDPNIAAAWSMLGWTHLVDARLAYSSSSEISLEQAAEFVEKGLELDADDADANSILGGIRLLQRRFDEAEALCIKGAGLGPSNADCHIWLGFVYVYRGRPEQALTALRKAMRLSPIYPDWYNSIVGLCYRSLGRPDDALDADRKRLELNPQNPFSHFRMAAVLAECGQWDEARKHVAAALASNPGTSLRQVHASEPFEDDKEMERYLDLLRQAGLPES